MTTWIMINVSNLPVLLLSCHKGAHQSRRVILDKELSAKLQKNRTPWQAGLRNEKTGKYDDNFNYNIPKACPDTILYDRETDWFSLFLNFVKFL